MQRDRSIFAHGLNFEGSDFKPEANYRGQLEGTVLHWKLSRDDCVSPFSFWQQDFLCTSHSFRKIYFWKLLWAIAFGDKPKSTSRTFSNACDGAFLPVNEAWICIFNQICEKFPIIFSVFACYFLMMFNTLLPSVPLLYPLKTSESQRFSDIFRENKKGVRASNELIHIYFIRAELH